MGDQSIWRIWKLLWSSTRGAHNYPQPKKAHVIHSRDSLPCRCTKSLPNPPTLEPRTRLLFTSPVKCPSEISLCDTHRAKRNKREIFQGHVTWVRFKPRKLSPRHLKYVMHAIISWLTEVYEWSGLWGAERALRRFLAGGDEGDWSCNGAFGGWESKQSGCLCVFDYRCVFGRHLGAGQRLRASFLVGQSWSRGIQCQKNGTAFSKWSFCLIKPASVVLKGFVTVHEGLMSLQIICQCGVHTCSTWCQGTITLTMCYQSVLGIFIVT